MSTAAPAVPTPVNFEIHSPDVKVETGDAELNEHSHALCVEMHESTFDTSIPIQRIASICT